MTKDKHENDLQRIHTLFRNLRRLMSFSSIDSSSLVMFCVEIDGDSNPSGTLLPLEIRFKSSFDFLRARTPTVFGACNDA